MSRLFIRCSLFSFLLVALVACGTSVASIGKDMNGKTKAEVKKKFGKPLMEVSQDQPTDNGPCQVKPGIIKRVRYPRRHRGRLRRHDLIGDKEDSAYEIDAKHYKELTSSGE